MSSLTCNSYLDTSVSYQSEDSDAEEEKIWSQLIVLYIDGQCIEFQKHKRQKLIRLIQKYNMSIREASKRVGLRYSVAQLIVKDHKSTTRIGKLPIRKRNTAQQSRLISTKAKTEANQIARSLRQSPLLPSPFTSCKSADHPSSKPLIILPNLFGYKESASISDDCLMQGSPCFPRIDQLYNKEEIDRFLNTPSCFLDSQNLRLPNSKNIIESFIQEEFSFLEHHYRVTQALYRAQKLKSRRTSSECIMVDAFWEGNIIKNLHSHQFDTSTPQMENMQLSQY